MKRNGKMNSTASFFFSHGKTNGIKKLGVINKKCDNSGRILLLEVNIDDSIFVLINIYNANNEPDQLNSLNDLGEITDCIGDFQNKNTFFGGDVNVIFDSILEAQEGEPI